jgi:plasmid stability protein
MDRGKVLFVVTGMGQILARDLDDRVIESLKTKAARKARLLE